jgi:hypothetical protein
VTGTTLTGEGEKIVKSESAQIIERCIIWFAAGYCLGLITMAILSTVEVMSP